MFGLKKNFKEDSVEAYVTAACSCAKCECSYCHCNVQSYPGNNNSDNAKMSTLSGDNNNVFWRNNQ